MWGLIIIGIVLYLLSQQSAQQTTRRVTRRLSRSEERPSRSEESMDITYRRNGQDYQVKEVERLVVDEKPVITPLPPEPPVPEPPKPPEPIPPTGNWANVLAIGYKCNKRLRMGYGFHEQDGTGINTSSNKITYFIIDPLAYTGLDYSGRAIAVRVADYNQSASGSSMNTGSKARVITVDKNGDERAIYNLVGENNTFSGTVYYKSGDIYIIEHTQGDLRGAVLSSWWP